MQGKKLKIVQVHPGILPIPPNGWGAVEKIIWEYKCNLEKLGHVCDVLYLNDIDPLKYDIIHVHMANLALMLYEKNIPYFFTCHDHHTYIYGKESQIFKQNYLAMKHSVKSFVPAKYLVEYYDLPNVYYLSHGVNTDFFKNVKRSTIDHKILCVANNGIGHDNTHDRKGFGFAIKAAKNLNLPITVAGPDNNKNFFNNFDFKYNKLIIKYNLTETELLNTYQDHTIFVHASDLEAGHPNLTLLEAMSCGLPVVGTMEKNNNLEGMIKTTRNVEEITSALKTIIDNYENFKNKSLNTANEKRWGNITDQLVSMYTITSMKDSLTQIYKQTSINHIEPNSPNNEIFFDYNNGCRVEILGSVPIKYTIKIFDDISSSLVYSTELGNNMWGATNIKYYVKWRVEVTDKNTGTTVVDKFDLTGKKVKIVNDSPALGDIIAWISIINKFQKVNGCIIDLYTPHLDLFSSIYTNINFKPYSEHRNDTKYYASYVLGYFDPNDRNLSPKDCRTQNLQQIAADILGVEYKEIVSNVVVKNPTRPIPEKYVCISTSSTAGCKHWQNKTGWQQTVDYLNSKGFKVVVIQKEALDYMDLSGLQNVIHPITPTVHDAITWINSCEFFIGLGSGNSWLAWALKKKIVLISGFSKPLAEFFTPYRVINESVCHGCWNNTLYKFNAGDWNWCPAHKDTERQFECSKQITFNMVKEKIDSIL